MSVCRATKRDGAPCTLPSNGISGLCWAHDPANAERRRRGQSRGGKNKPGKELTTIKQRLSDLADDVLAGEVDRADAAVAGQLLNTVIRAVSVELKAREQLELIERLEALEETLARNKENRRYGA
jgi:LPS O-antigen subunit length determinant protein (WzzB/FepE family)